MQINDTIYRLNDFVLVKIKDVQYRAVAKIQQIIPCLSEDEETAKIFIK